MRRFSGKEKHSRGTGFRRKNRGGTWRSLENTAKIFPATSGKRDERVFRISCQLTEEVQPEKLQEALDLCVEDYRLFLCVLRVGLFWNYLEESPLRPVVREEFRPPCSQIYVRDQKNLLFEVTYYRKRISFETYHALTDGTGAMQFVRTLIYRYLMLTHPEQVNGEHLSEVQPDATEEEKEEDSFARYYTSDGNEEKIPKYRAHQLRCHRTESGNIHLTEGILPLHEMLAEARKYGVTLTVYVTAVFLCAIAKDMSERQKKKPVALMIPVNLRNYFPSESVRNFFGWIDIGYDFSSRSQEFADVVAYTSEFFRKELTPERIAARMNSLMKMERNPLMRLLPLPVKLWGMQAGAALACKDGTAVFSNIGQIRMPEECSGLIEWFDFYTTTPKMEICMCSYEDRLTISFTSAFTESRIERNFFRMLTAQGIPVQIISWQEGEG